MKNREKIFLFLLAVFFLVLALFLYKKQLNKGLTSQSTPPLSKNGTSNTIDGTFEGITPCGNGERPLPQIPASAQCEMMIWHITFQSDATYALTSHYGMSQPGTPGIRGGGTRIHMEGNWTVSKGAEKDSQATVIRLSTDDPQTSVSFLKINDSLIHVLDANKKMMVGNGGWSYTLNNTSSGDRTVVPLNVSTSTQPPTSASLPSGASVLGVFEGRTPCQDFLFAFTKNSVSSPSGCERIKWRLTFYRNSQADNQTRYIFGVQGRAGSHKGKWDTIIGIPADPEATVYRLTPEGSNQTVSLLKVDDHHLFFLDQDMNILVGDALWSYTVSKVD